MVFPLTGGAMKYEIKSFNPKSDKDPYFVEAHDKGKRWTCTCPHFVFRLKKSGTHCKHIDYVLKHRDELDVKRYEAAEQEFWANFTMEEPEKPDIEDSTKQASGD